MYHIIIITTYTFYHFLLQIHLASNNITLHKLVTSSPRFTGKPYSLVYQLCICDSNGKLFLSPAQGNCQANSETCS